MFLEPKSKIFEIEMIILFFDTLFEICVDLSEYNSSLAGTNFVILTANYCNEDTAPRTVGYSTII